MRITNPQIMMASLLLSVVASSAVYAEVHQHNVATIIAHASDSTATHKNQHGGQIYQRTELENSWLKNHDRNASYQGSLKSMIGTDENRLYVKASADKAESDQVTYQISALYSRMLDDYWDGQIGVRYRENRELSSQKNTDFVVGLYGLAPYFFESDFYLYVGQDDYLAVEISLERDFLWTQKLISQPYLEMNLVLQDHGKYTQQTGFSEWEFGIKTRYEVTKRIKPFVDVGYVYDKGKAQTDWQEQTSSESYWRYGFGLELLF